MMLPAVCAFAAPREQKNPSHAREQKSLPTREQLALCSAKNGAAADLRIDACTAVIEAKNFKASKADAYLVRAEI